MKNVLKVDSVNKRLVMDRSFAKEAEIVGSEAYILLQNARRDYPTYTVVRRQIKRNAAKECYRGLTYEYMESYIASHDNAASRRAEYVMYQIVDKNHFSVIVEVEVSPLFFGWLCGFGNKVRIMQPAAVKREFQDYLGKILYLY